jgi:serine O-acetyltransferase
MNSRASLLQESLADLRFSLEEDPGNRFARALTNRGFHALLAYRIAHRLRKAPLSFVGFLLTRTIQVIYGIDIDPRAKIAGGIIIYHGVGVVIGSGAVIEPRVILFHGVTLGIKRSGRRDGFPHVETGVILGSGAKLLGKIVIGSKSVIGANAVIVEDIPSGSVAKPAPIQVSPRYQPVQESLV